jgi:hypothetical protein
MVDALCSPPSSSLSRSTKLRRPSAFGIRVRGASERRRGRHYSTTTEYCNEKSPGLLPAMHGCCRVIGLTCIVVVYREAVGSPLLAFVSGHWLILPVVSSRMYALLRRGGRMCPLRLCGETIAQPHQTATPAEVDWYSASVDQEMIHLNLIGDFPRSAASIRHLCFNHSIAAEGALRHV